MGCTQQAAAVSRGRGHLHPEMLHTWPQTKQLLLPLLQR